MFYLTKETLPIFLPLGFVGVYRWFWFFVKVMHTEPLTLRIVYIPCALHHLFTFTILISKLHLSFLLKKLLAYCLYKPLKPRRKPRFKPHRDVTIVIPTIDSGEEIKLAIRSWLKCEPFEIIFVTTTKAFAALEGLAREVDPEGRVVRVITVTKPNKRNQMVKGINHVKTEICVMCDDDVLWPTTMLKWMLAPFEDKQMGGVGE